MMLDCPNGNPSIKPSPFRLAAAWAAILIGTFAAPLPSPAGLSFNGTSQYVTFGNDTNLATATFTLETWFNWSGGGNGTSSGRNGISAIPLIAKASTEKDGSKEDGNYFLGIDENSGRLVADMEEGAEGRSPGRNHPVISGTVVTPNTWHHAAVAYDGTNWFLFVNGYLDTTLSVRRPVRADSIQHAALASALNSKGKPHGHFEGILDEVRIWSYARSTSQIASNMNVQIPSAPGLLGRWALDETNGFIAPDSSGNNITGKLVNRPAWTNGYRAPFDIVAPIKIIAIDPIRSEALRQAEMRRVPPIYRYDNTIAKQAESRFRTNFLLARERFLVALHDHFPSQRVDSETVDAPAFAEMVSAFQADNKGFPLDVALARRWALNPSDNSLQDELAEQLQKIMGDYLRTDRTPREVRIGTSSVRILSLGLNSPSPTIDFSEKHGLIRPRTRMTKMGEARDDLEKLFPTNQTALASYLGEFFQENCVFDPELTHQSRTRTAETIHAADHYEPGDLIVKQGQIINSKIQAALDELSSGTAADTLKAQATADAIKTQAELDRAQAQTSLTQLQQQTAIAEFKSDLFGTQNRWLFVGLVLVAVLSSFAVWRLARPKPPLTLFPALPDSNSHLALPGPPNPETTVQTPDPSSHETEAMEWKARALTAEQRAAQTSAAMRTHLLPHLLKWIKEKFMVRLVSDRSHLLDTQEKAKQDLAELEKRLATLHTPIHQRLRAYENRIADLERELTATATENSELIKAKIELTRSKLAAEQGNSHVNNN